MRIINEKEIPLDRPVSIDFETPGYKDFTPILLAAAWKDDRGDIQSIVFEIDKMSDRQQEALKERIVSVKRLNAHNIFFELRVLHYWGADIWKLFGKIDDSMIMIGVYDTGGKKGLKENDWRVGMELSTYKESVKAGRKEFIDYCRDDAICCHLLREMYLPKMQERKTDTAYEMELRLVWVVLKIYFAGFYIDQKAVSEKYVEVEKQLQDIKVELNVLAGKALNFNSTGQLRELLYKDFELSPNPDFYTSGGKKGDRQPGTSKAALEDIAYRLPDTKPGAFAKKLLDYRELSKFWTTYLGEGFTQHIEPDGKIRTSLNQLATASSRFSSSDPNLQNIPSRGIGKVLREYFTATPGNKLLQIDYSQIEYRFIVHYMQDKNLIEAYKRGEDFHTATSNIFQVDRSLGKKLNFTLVYLGGVKKLAITLGISEEQAREYYDLYHSGLPNLKKFYRSVEAFTRMSGYVRMTSGRCRGFEEQIKQDAYITSEVGNTVVQGNAGELIKLAMIQIDDIMPSNISMILQVHDELIFDGPEKELTEFSHEVKRIMENATEISVPIIAEPKIVNTWAESKD